MPGTLVPIARRIEIHDAVNTSLEREEGGRGKGEGGSAIKREFREKFPFLRKKIRCPPEYICCRDTG